MIIDKDVRTRWSLLCRTVKALLESGGLVVKVVRASSSSPTMDGRKTWALTFCVLLFERAKRLAQPMQHRAPARHAHARMAERTGPDSIFGNFSGHADGERRGLDRIGG